MPKCIRFEFQRPVCQPWRTAPRKICGTVSPKLSNLGWSTCRPSASSSRLQAHFSWIITFAAAHSKHFLSCFRDSLHFAASFGAGALHRAGKTFPAALQLPPERNAFPRKARWRMPGSNRRPPACKAGALPTELIPHRSPPHPKPQRQDQGTKTERKRNHRMPRRHNLGTTWTEARQRTLFGSAPCSWRLTISYSC